MGLVIASTIPDPRATHSVASRTTRASGNLRLFEMSRRIEETVNREKKLNANVDFYRLDLL
jgi:citrate synthase